MRSDNGVLISLEKNSFRTIQVITYLGYEMNKKIKGKQKLKPVEKIKFAEEKSYCFNIKAATISYGFIIFFL